MAHPLLTPAAIEIVRSGGLVIFPTETLYGLGCLATDETAVRRLFEVKGRAPGQPPPVLVSGEEQLRMLVEQIPAAAAELITAHWPGALTLVLPARDDVPALLTGVSASDSPAHRGLPGVRRTIGVRHSAHLVAQALCEAVGAPVVATSANYSGASGPAALPRALADVPASLRQTVDLVIDGGQVTGQPSTVIDCTCDPPRVLRQGGVTFRNAECGMWNVE